MPPSENQQRRKRRSPRGRLWSIGPQWHRREQQRKAQAHARRQQHREVFRLRQLAQAWHRLRVGAFAARLDAVILAVLLHPRQHPGRQVVHQLVGPEVQAFAVAHAPGRPAAARQRKDVGAAVRQVGREHLQIDRTPRLPRCLFQPRRWIARGPPQVAEGQRRPVRRQAGGGLDLLVQPGRQRLQAAPLAHAAAHAETVGDQALRQVEPDPQPDADHQRRHQPRRGGHPVQPLPVHRDAGAGHQQRDRPVADQHAADDGADAPPGAAGVERADQHAEQTARARLGLEQAQQPALPPAEPAPPGRPDVLLQLLRQAFQQREAGARIAGATLVFGRRRDGRGDRPGRGAADALEAVVARQPGDRLGVHDAAGDAAFHHQIAEAVAGCVFRGACIHAVSFLVGALSTRSNVAGPRRCVHSARRPRPARYRFDSCFAQCRCVL